MKKLIVASVLVLSANFSNAQIVPILNENFNAGFPSGWLSIDGDQKTPAAAVSYAGYAYRTHDDFDSLSVGDSILIATSWFNPVGKANNYLILPQVTLQANGNFLVFEAKSKDPSYPESFEILVSTTNADTASLTDTLYAEALLSPNWTLYTIDLDNYVNQSIYISIHHSSNDKFLLCLDNFNIYADLQNSVEDIENINFQVYPNPSNGLFTIQSSKAPDAFSVYDMNGKLILQQSANQQLINQVDLSAFPKGLYILQLQIGQQSFHRKLICK